MLFHVSRSAKASRLLSRPKSASSGEARRSAFGTEAARYEKRTRGLLLRLVRRRALALVQSETNAAARHPQTLLM